MSLYQIQQLALNIYKLTTGFPDHERFCLTIQLRKAVISVPSNIVEGRARETVKEYIRFLVIARASLEEAKYQILLARDLGYVYESIYLETNSLMVRVSKLLAGLLRELRQRSTDA